MKMHEDIAPEERDYKIEIEALEGEVEVLRNEVENNRNSMETLKKENEELNNTINEYREYCNNIIKEVGQLKEESIVLMKKVIMYQEMEIRQIKENK